MREIRTSGSEGGGLKPMSSPYPYFNLTSPAADKIEKSKKFLSPDFDVTHLLMVMAWHFGAT